MIQIPEPQLQLMLEIRNNHPDLLAKLRGQGFEEQVAIMAAHCEIVIDCYVNVEDMERLFDQIYRELRSRSTIVVS